MACCCSLAGTAACSVCANRPSMFASSTTFTPPTPIVTYVPERTCRNVEKENPDFWFICSECNHVSLYFESNINYCPNCGARVVDADC